MSIFRRDASGPARPPATSVAEAVPAAPPRGQVTQIAAGSRLEGQITGTTEVLVEGEIEGTVKVEATVVVGAQGVVKGPITGRIVRVAGRVIGNVRGSDRVEVGPAASLEGDISAPRVVIAEGAFFKGKVEMQGEKAPASRSKPAAEPRKEP